MMSTVHWSRATIMHYLCRGCTQTRTSTCTHTSTRSHSRALSPHDSIGLHYSILTHTVLSLFIFH
jgi:hypothetical protein